MSVAFFSDYAAAPSVYAFAHFYAQFYLQLLISERLFPSLIDRQGFTLSNNKKLL